MEINDVNQENYFDIFSKTGKTEIDETQQLANPQFGAEEKVVDIFEKKEGTELEDKKEEDTTVEEKKQEEVDILGDQGKPGRKPKYAFEDAVGYFEDRFKSGKFVKVTTENEKGEEVPFIPKTPEEFDEVIEIQVNYKLDQAKKDLEQSWYKTKPAAWQAVAKYAEMVQDPADIIPFIQGVQTIQSVSEINENEIDGAEQIVRTRLAQRGDTDDIISNQIEILKTANKLIDTAKVYKPLIIKEEKEYLAELDRNEKIAEARREQLVKTIRTNAVKAIETPLFGNQKLKIEEKQVIYDLIAEPDKESQGFKIYNAIDNLFEKGDFDTLTKVALLLTKPESFINYATIEAKNKTASTIQKKLMVASESRNNSKVQEDEGETKVQRRQYVSTPRFGR